MNKPVVTDVEPNVRKLESACIEKHEIARLQIIARNGVANACLLARAAWQRNSRGLLKYVANQSAAIKALFWRVAAKTIADADQRKRVARDIGG